MTGESCEHRGRPGEATRYGEGPDLRVAERGPCGQCGEPVLTDDSFVKLRSGTYLHTSNAVPSCVAAYDAELRRLQDGAE